MERVKQLVSRIASTPDSHLSELSLFHRSLLFPVLSFSSLLFRISLLLRRRLYLSSLLPTHRLPLPVISVGNITWGGNGKTPMVEFIAAFFDEIGVPPLVLTRGFAGGDEARMLKRHLVGSTARIGVGSDRKAVADLMFRRYGCVDRSLCLERLSCSDESRGGSMDGKLGVVILDDGMQHWSLTRDVEIVMVNGLMPWGNNHFIPRGPLREPLSALGRADVVVIHHADLVSDEELTNIRSMIQKICPSVPIFLSRLSPSHFFDTKNNSSIVPLSAIRGVIVLCVSAIGFPDAFVHVIRKIGPLHVDRLDFTDHHVLGAKDIAVVRKRLRELEDGFKIKAVVVLTEKDYDRDPAVLKQLHDLSVLILCSSLQILPSVGRTIEDFRKKLKKIILFKWGGETSPL